MTAPTGRSIPDILGWKEAPREWGYADRMWEHPTDGYVIGADRGWTADDLLAWLGQQGYVWSIQRWDDHDIAVVAVHHRMELPRPARRPDRSCCA